MWSVADSHSSTAQDMSVTFSGILTASVKDFPDYPSTGEKEGSSSGLSVQFFWEGRSVPRFHQTCLRIHINSLILPPEFFLSLTQQVSKPPLLQHDEHLVNPQFKKKNPTNKQTKPHRRAHEKQQRKELGSIFKSSYHNRSPNYILLWVTEITIQPS